MPGIPCRRRGRSSFTRPTADPGTAMEEFRMSKNNNPANQSQRGEGPEAVALKNFDRMGQAAQAALCALTPQGRLWLRLAAHAAELWAPDHRRRPLDEADLDRLVMLIADRLR